MNKFCFDGLKVGLGVSFVTGFGIVLPRDSGLGDSGSLTVGDELSGVSKFCFAGLEEGLNVVGLSVSCVNRFGIVVL